ncbi:Sphingolipid delta(4)-desaturase DES1, partial [Quaeritorhiza haematococci]
GKRTWTKYLSNYITTVLINLRQLNYRFLFTKEGIPIWILVGIGAVLGLVVFVNRNEALKLLVDFSNMLKGLGFWGHLLLFLCVFLTSFPPLVGHGILLYLCGFVLGFPMGVFPAYLGGVAGACGCFLLWRRFLGKFYRKRFLSVFPEVEALERAVNQGGLKFLILIRLAPYPFGLLNIVFGTMSKKKPKSKTSADIPSNGPTVPIDVYTPSSKSTHQPTHHPSTTTPKPRAHPTPASSTEDDHAITFGTYTLGTAIALLKYIIFVYIGSTLRDLAEATNGTTQSLFQDPVRLGLVVGGLVLAVVIFVLITLRVKKILKEFNEERAMEEEEEMEVRNGGVEKRLKSISFPQLLQNSSLRLPSLTSASPSNVRHHPEVTRTVLLPYTKANMASTTTTTIAPTDGPRSRKQPAKSASASSPDTAESAKSQKNYPDSRHPTYVGDWKRSIPYTDEGISLDDLDEPHVKRKLAILDKHPEIQQLYGYESSTKYITAACVAAQVALAYLFGRVLVDWHWTMIIGSYVVGASITQMFGVVIHEATHNLMSPSPFVNRVWGLIANIGIVFPIFASFRRYHLDHHAYQGVVDKDPDLPLAWEYAFVKGNPFFKFLFLFFYPLMYVVRGAAMQKQPSKWEIINWVFTISTDVILWNVCGPRGFLYLFLSLWFGYGIHPAAAHFIQEHYTSVDGQETYSYYGSMNKVFLNIGYHNEHHDFTKVAWKNLPSVKAIAPEFYDTLASYQSWVGVLVDFVFNPTMGPQSRVGRTLVDHRKGRKMIVDRKAAEADNPTEGDAAKTDSKES